MKRYNEQHIRKAEIAQLILLYHIYAQTGSQDLVFQGGTALRWCYGGSRFSEDLDFVTALPETALDALLAARRQAGMTQEQVAAKMGVSQPSLARVEASLGSHRHSPSLEMLRKYAAAVNCKLEIKLIPQHL